MDDSSTCKRIVLLAAHRERPQAAWVRRNVRAIHTHDRENFLHIAINALDQIRLEPRIVRLCNEDAIFLQRFINALIEARVKDSPLGPPAQWNRP